MASSSALLFCHHHHHHSCFCLRNERWNGNVYAMGQCSSCFPSEAWLPLSIHCNSSGFFIEKHKKWTAAHTSTDRPIWVTKLRDPEPRQETWQEAHFRLMFFRNLTVYCDTKTNWGLCLFLCNAKQIQINYFNWWQPCECLTIIGINYCVEGIQKSVTQAPNSAIFFSLWYPMVPSQAIVIIEMSHGAADLEWCHPRLWSSLVESEIQALIISSPLHDSISMSASQVVFIFQIIQRTFKSGIKSLVNHLSVQHLVHPHHHPAHVSCCTPACRSSPDGCVLQNNSLKKMEWNFNQASVSRAAMMGALRASWILMQTSKLVSSLSRRRSHAWDQCKHRDTRKPGNQEIFLFHRNQLNFETRFQNKANTPT